MSTDVRATSPASPLLRGLSDRIVAPLPRKTRFLRELAGDIRELTAHLTQEGLERDEARRRALEALVPDEETLRRLELLHRTPYRRWTDGWDPRRLRRVERLALTGAFAGLFLVQGSAILRADAFRHVSPFLWPVLLTGAWLTLYVGHLAFEVWVKGEHHRHARGLRGLVLLSALPVAVAVAGTWTDVLSLARRLEAAPELAGELVLRILIQDGTLLSIAILSALVGALAWLLFTQWAVLQEEAHRRALDSSNLPEVGHE